MFAITQIPAKTSENITSPFGNCGQFRADIRSHHNWHIPEPLAESSHRTFCNVIISWTEGFQLLNAHEKHHALFALVLAHLWASRWLGGPSGVPPVPVYGLPRRGCSFYPCFESLCHTHSTFPAEIMEDGVLADVVDRCNYLLTQGCQTGFSYGATSGMFNLKRAWPMKSLHNTLVISNDNFQLFS